MKLTSAIDLYMPVECTPTTSGPAARQRPGPGTEGMTSMQDQPIGLCQCGCGQPAPTAPYNNRGRGWIKGEPLRFVHGHGGRRRQRDKEYVVEPDSGCWIWQKARNSGGYGISGAEGGALAHRLYYREARGDIPATAELDHLCRNRACVNPDHLEPVTHLENVRRGARPKGGAL